MFDEGLKKKRNSISYYFFYFLCILATGLSLAGYLGRLNLYLEFASGYKLQFLLLGLFSLIYFLLTRKKIGIVLSLCCVIINLAEIIPWYFNPPEINNLEQQQPLKVFSYNVLWSNKNYAQAIALINQEQPDIAVFQEVKPPWDKELKVLQFNFPYHISAQKVDIEIYSKLPLTNTEIEFYGTNRGLVISDLKIGDRATRTGKANRNIKFVATHAYPQLSYGNEGWQIRNQHLEIGIGEYAKNLEQPAIFLGDLNVTMWSPFYRSLIRSSNLHNARQGFGIVPTQSGIAPQIAAFSAPIDHCLVSTEIQVKNFQSGRAIGSDHLPIIADLLIPQK